MMDWVLFLQIVCVPAFGYVFYQLGVLKKDLDDFEIKVAEQYSTKSDIRRIENKIDDVHNFLIDILRNKEM